MKQQFPAIQLRCNFPSERKTTYANLVTLPFFSLTCLTSIDHIIQVPAGSIEEEIKYSTDRRNR